MTLSDENENLIDEVLTRSVDSIYPSLSLLKKELTSRKLKIYVGIDPTATYVHLGHSTNYLILERLHKMGHKIIVLIGDFTAAIGDPSDKSSARVKLSNEEINDNLKSFKEQIGKILDFDDKNNVIEFKFNSEWLSKLSFENLLELASNFTVQQLLERDMFKLRLKDEKPLYLHEFFYVLMQGYDSVAMDVDLEIGGTDQTFNMLAGRTLQKRYNNKEKYVLTTTLLTNPITGEKLMSKSLGTGIGLNEESREMFEKVMRIPDSSIVQLYTDCTRASMDYIREIKTKLDDPDINPRDIKKDLSLEIVSMYHGEHMAKEALQYWEDKYSKQVIPASIDPVFLGNNVLIADVLFTNKIIESKNKVRKLIDQNAISINNEKITSPDHPLKPGDVIKIGKRIIVEVQP